MDGMVNNSESWFDLVFMGHGHCYLWREDLVALHSISDTLIAGSYFTIPLALYVLMHKRKDLEYEWMFLLFALFIFTCGLTHLMAVYNIWNGAYYVSGVLKAITAVVSLATAILIWPLIPKALTLPRPMELKAANQQLTEEVERRAASEEKLRTARVELEQRVKELTTTKESLEQEINQRRTLEQQERKKTEALRRSNQELEQFAFIASHDLREPLRKLLAFTDLLATGNYGQFSHKGQQFVTHIRDAAKRMDALINSLLNYSRVSSRSQLTEYVDLNEVLSEACKDLQFQIDDCKASIHVEIDLCNVRGDRVQLHQLFQNLISNSLKYRSHNSSPEIHIRSKVDFKKHRCSVEVSDNGIGFDMNYHDQIFEVFKRLHGVGEYEGTGMGLAICRKIVERHGGKIRALSSEGKGSVFIFDLPVAE